MHFPLLLTFVRQLLRWLTFGWWQLALWLAGTLRLLTGVRSAFHSGALPTATGSAVRPRRVHRAGGFTSQIRYHVG